jgi:hypothetical protein
LKVIEAGLIGPGVGVGPGGCVTVAGDEPEAPAVPLGATEATSLAAGVFVAAADPPLCPTIMRAPATPISSAHTTPSKIETFFQILSSTPDPPVRSIDRR